MGKRFPRIPRDLEHKKDSRTLGKGSPISIYHSNKEGAYWIISKSTYPFNRYVEIVPDSLLKNLKEQINEKSLIEPCREKECLIRDLGLENMGYKQYFNVLNGLQLLTSTDEDVSYMMYKESGRAGPPHLVFYKNFSDKDVNRALIETGVDKETKSAFLNGLKDLEEPEQIRTKLNLIKTYKSEEEAEILGEHNLPDRKIEEISCEDPKKTFLLMGNSFAYSCIPSISSIHEDLEGSLESPEDYNVLVFGSGDLRDSHMIARTIGDGSNKLTVYRGHLRVPVICTEELKNLGIDFDTLSEKSSVHVNVPRETLNSFRESLTKRIESEYDSKNGSLVKPEKLVKEKVGLKALFSEEKSEEPEEELNLF